MAVVFRTGAPHALNSHATCRLCETFVFSTYSTATAFSALVFMLVAAALCKMHWL